MNDLTWKLPSVVQFYQSVVDDLDAGTIVVVHLPPHAPSNVSSALRQMIAEGLRHKDLVEVGSDELSVTTITSFANRLARVAMGAEARAVSSVAEFADLANHRVYCVEGGMPPFSVPAVMKGLVG